MSNSTKWTLILSGVGIVIILLCLKFCKSNPIIPVDLTIHDTVVKKFYIHDTVKGATIVIPTKVTYYDSIPIIQDSAYVMVYHDTIRIMKHDTIEKEVSADFIKLFPESPKLIIGRFYPNVIALNLLQTDGNIVTKQYTIDYSKFYYEFLGTELKSYPIPKTGNFITQGLKAFTTTSSFSTFYNPFTQQAMSQLDYMINYKAISAGAMGQFTTGSINPFFGGIGIRVKIK